MPELSVEYQASNHEHCPCAMRGRVHACYYPFPYYLFPEQGEGGGAQGIAPTEMGSEPGWWLGLNQSFVAVGGKDVFTFRAVIEGVAVFVCDGDGFGLYIDQQDGIVSVHRAGVVFAVIKSHVFPSFCSTCLTC
jgi:hypothetical protein